LLGISAIFLATVLIFFRPLNVEKYNFFDPTGNIKVNISVDAQGKNIFKDVVNATSPILLYGDYNLRVYAFVFEKYFHVKGNAIDAEDREYLLPDRSQIMVSEKEFAFVENFLRDFQKLFFALPKQYYIYKKDHVISLGDMILLQCEKDAFDRNGLLPIYFVSKEREYMRGSVEKKSDCYRSIIEKNAQPTDLRILGIKYNSAEYNVKKRAALVSYTFDIESGRYLNELNRGKYGLSQCGSSVFSFGLSKSEKICDNADVLPFFSNYTGVTEGYPWTTGIRGFHEILNYSFNYGLPTTQYVVIRDLQVFEKLNPTLIEQLQHLLKEDFIELGVHTHYHRYLGKDREGDEQDLAWSKNYLERKFNTTVSGMRGPYLTLVGNDATLHAQTLKKLNYTYFSNLGEFTLLEGVASLGPNLFLVSDKDVFVFREVIANNRYVVTLDHPWNLAYKEVDVNGEIYLEGDTSRIQHFKMAVLMSISEGGIFVRARELIDDLRKQKE
jgi:peptidoglycan/xylan/chitin deacetylase (PgdA/CDA1 family)